MNMGLIFYECLDAREKLLIMMGGFSWVVCMLVIREAWYEETKEQVD